MSIKVDYFGLVADLTSCKEEVIAEDGTFTVFSLRSLLEKKYPGLKNINYSVAVNLEMISKDMPINDTDQIALLPPFAGG